MKTVKLRINVNTKQAGMVYVALTESKYIPRIGETLSIQMSHTESSHPRKYATFEIKNVVHHLGNHEKIDHWKIEDLMESTPTSLLDSAQDVIDLVVIPLGEETIRYIKRVESENTPF